MKKVVSPFFLSFVFFISHAQVTIDNSHLPIIKDSFFYNTDTLKITAPVLQSGLFDFSKLKKHTSSFLTFSANTDLVSYPNSNLKSRSDGDTTTDIYLKKTANDINIISFNTSSIPLPFPISTSLTGSLKYLSFPLTASSTITSKDSLKISIPVAFIQSQFNIDSLIKTLLPPPYNLLPITIDSISVVLTFTSTIKSLASGKIKTPIDSNIDVLKIERKISFTYRVIANLSAVVPFVGKQSFPFDLSSLLGGQLPNIDLSRLSTTEHVFYTAKIKQPIVTATVDSMGNYIGINYRQKTILAPGSKVESNGWDTQQVSIHHFGNRIEVTNIPKGVTIRANVYSSDGRMVSNELLNHTHSEIAFQNGFEKSVYILILQDDQTKNIVKTHKFIRE